MDVFTLKQQFVEIAELAALAVARQLGPAFDEVKYREAVRLAGSERWLRFHLKEGNLHAIRRGEAKNSPRYYSRLEIAALRKAENELKNYTR